MRDREGRARGMRRGTLGTFGTLAALLGGLPLALLGASPGIAAPPAPSASAPAASAPPGPGAPAPPGETAARSGYFFVGGRYQRVEDKTLMVGQMFVQWREPETVSQPYPVVMVHGVSQTGVNFLGTPDGRPGWAQAFVAQGYRVYVIDQVGRGRSGTNPEIYGPYTRFSTRPLEETYTAQEIYDLFPQARLHTQWPGGPGVPGNAAFDQFYASLVPYLADTRQTEELVNPALLALLEKIGPAVLVTHGQGGLFGWSASDARPDLVKAHVAIEPNGPPFFDVRFRGGKDFWERTGEARARAYGLTRVPLAYEPAAKSPEDLGVVQAKTPAGEGRIRCWLQAEPARQLPRLARVPTLVVTAEASFRTPTDDCTTAYLTQAGAKPDTLNLADQGIRGNGHMMMLEMNSDRVAGALIGWITKRVR